MELTLVLSGAGGDWQVIDEVIDYAVIRQQNHLACEPACGEMLLRERGINDIDRVNIATETGVPVSLGELARVLNSFTPVGTGEWNGGGFVIEGASFSDILDLLISQGVWAADLRELGARLSHLVVVDGFDSEGRVMIRDPWDGTRYKMDKTEFMNYWTVRGLRWVEL